jgi:Carboxypeptidase regulatory-like domain
MFAQEPKSMPSGSMAQFDGQPSAEKKQDGNAGQRIDAPDPRTGEITGTVIDANHNPVPDANVDLEGRVRSESRKIEADDKGFFDLSGVQPGITYHITVSAPGFSKWNSGTVVLHPGQHLFLTNIKLQIETVVTSVTVTPETNVEIATQQVTVELHQRVLGIIPNFYTVFDRSAAPLTTKLKFRMAFRESADPIIFAGACFHAGINQATDQPNFVLGAQGYGQRLGAVYADDLTNSFFGDAILPSLLHQDPRYYYQGTGTIRSRAFHALSQPFITKGDNGRLQPNYSSVGGDLISGTLSNLYYPDSNRGAELVLQNTLINTGERALGALLKEFVLPRFTRNTKEGIVSPVDGSSSY